MMMSWLDLDRILSYRYYMHTHHFSKTTSSLNYVLDFKLLHSSTHVHIEVSQEKHFYFYVLCFSREHEDNIGNS